LAPFAISATAFSLSNFVKFLRSDSFTPWR